MPYLGDLHFRDVGHGEPPIVVLHGGWGYAYYPFDHAIGAIPRRFVIPDRSGYGVSRPRDALSPGFHAMYAAETLALLDALGIRRCVLWGHSDGAVIAVHVALQDPQRCAGIILEALHVDREKPRSREFFTMMATNPDAFGERVTQRLASQLGDNWRTIIRADGQAWLDIAATPDDDMFDHRLHELGVPTLVLHGSEDPRTEPGELDRLRREVPHARIHMVVGGKHAPHCDRDHAAECTKIVTQFLAVLPTS